MFDPYRKWLGIPQWEQPADHYRLLGITVFEHDPDVIEAAADRQMAHIRNYQSGHHSELSQTILNELAAARVCLLNAEKKKAYDEQLRMELAQKSGQIQIAGPPFGFFVKGAIKYFLVQAQRAWIAQSVLPGAYLALGRDVHGTGNYRDRLEDLYARLEKVTQGLAALDQPSSPHLDQKPKPVAKPVPEPDREPPAEKPDAPPTDDQPETDASAGPGFFGRIKNWLWASFFTQRRKGLLREIGRGAFRIDGPACGPSGLTEPVRQSLARLEELRNEIELLSEVPPNTWLSPKRLAWIVLTILTVLVLLFFWARAML